MIIYGSFYRCVAGCGVLFNRSFRKHEETEKNAYESAFGNKHIIPAWNIHRGNHSIVIIYILSIATGRLRKLNVICYNF